MSPKQGNTLPSLIPRAQASKATRSWDGAGDPGRAAAGSEPWPCSSAGHVPCASQPPVGTGLPFPLPSQPHSQLPVLWEPGTASAQPVTRQHQRRARYRYADTGAREPNATASRLMRSSLQCSPQEKGHTRTRRAPNPPLLPARAKRGEKCPDPPPAPKTTGAPRAPPLHHGSSPLHQLIPTSFEPAHRKMIHIPRQALKSKEYQICSCPHNVTSGLRACVLHSE